MKAITTLTILCLMAVSTAQAQKTISKPAYEPARLESVDILVNKLEVSPEHREKFIEAMTVLKETQQKIEASSISDTEKTKKLAAINDQTNGILKSLLTEDQLITYLKEETPKSTF